MIEIEIGIYDLKYNELGRAELVLVRDSGISSERCIETAWGAVDTINSVFEADKQREENVYLMALDQGQVKGLFIVAHGTSDKSLLNIRGIFQRLLLCDASSFIIAHNHPSGRCEKMGADQTATEQIKKAASIMEIKFLDHIIIGSILGESQYYSFLENGQL